jgi:hypothetical protein
MAGLFTHPAFARHGELGARAQLASRPSAVATFCGKSRAPTPPSPSPFPDPLSRRLSDRGGTAAEPPCGVPSSPQARAIADRSIYSPSSQ